MRIYGIPQCRDKCYGAAAALTYWVFKSRDRATSPAMGTKTWTYLESSIKNSAEVSTCLEEYLQHLSDKLKSHLRPSVLTGVIETQQRILRFVEFRGAGGWWAVASDCRWFGDAGEYLGRNWQQAEKTIKYLFS